MQMTPYFDANDESLVELTLLGNEKAYEELVIRHERAVRGTAFKVTKNEYSAEDASQDAFVSAWMNLDSLRYRDRFGSWVCSIAKNCAKNIVARYKSAVPDISFDLQEYLDATDPDGNGLVEMFHDDSRADELHEAVEALGSKIRESIILHYFEGLSVREIAGKLSLPEGTVKWRLSEGRKQLRKGFGVMEKEYDGNETLTVRVMRQVEELKLWRLKNDKTGFESDYREVLACVEALDNSKEKSHALADVLRLGYWWLPGQKNDEVWANIKKAAEEGHNDEVMQSVMAEEHDKYEGQARIDYMQNTQIPYLEQNGFCKSLGYVLFWMGYAHRCLGEYEKAIEIYRRVMETLEPCDVYYANAKAAIHSEERLIEALKTNRNKHNVSPTGEVYRYIDDKLYFSEQPGYGYDNMDADSSLFWNCSQCDSLIYDPEMKPGDMKASSDGRMTLRFARSGVSVDTPAGRFDGCDVFTLDGEYHGLKHTETYFCRGVGIVKQNVEREDRRNTWVLSSYEITGDGMIPLAPGNRWQYECLTRDPAIECERENIFEVTGCHDGRAAVASSCFVLNLGFTDTWEGNTVKARMSYWEDGERLSDVKPEIERAVQLAGTKRQKMHAAIAKDVMVRILDTDPVLNPDYTRKGRWDFFSLYEIKAEDGAVSMADNNRKYGFEWKDMGKSGAEGLKVLYNFLYDILDDAAGCVWSDKWISGYMHEGDFNGYHTKLRVTGDVTATVPAGTFESCRCVSIERAGLSGGWSYRGGKFDYLFAPGIGIVKMIHLIDDSTDAIWELTEYRGTGNGYFPTGDGLFRRYEPQALGDGFHASVEYTFVADETGTVMFRNALGNQDRGNYEAMIAAKG